MSKEEAIESVLDFQPSQSLDSVLAEVYKCKYDKIPEFFSRHNSLEIRLAILRNYFQKSGFSTDPISQEGRADWEKMILALKNDYFHTRSESHMELYHRALSTYLFNSEYALTIDVLRFAIGLLYLGPETGIYVKIKDGDNAILKMIMGRIDKGIANFKYYRDKPDKIFYLNDNNSGQANGLTMTKTLYLYGWVDAMHQEMTDLLYSMLNRLDCDSGYDANDFKYVRRALELIVSQREYVSYAYKVKTMAERHQKLCKLAESKKYSASDTLMFAANQGFLDKAYKLLKNAEKDQERNFEARKVALDLAVEHNQKERNKHKERLEQLR